MMIFLLAETPATKLKDTLNGEIASLFLLVVMFWALHLFWKRRFTEFIGWALFAMLVGVFIYTPELIEELGTSRTSFEQEKGAPGTLQINI
jgi:hypothetical protein